MSCTRMNNILPELMWKYTSIGINDLIKIIPGVNYVPSRVLGIPDIIIKPIVNYKRRPIIKERFK